MVRLLDRYLALAVIGGTLTVLAVLLAINAFVVFLAELEDLGQPHHGLSQALMFVGLSLPKAAYEVFPVAVLLGALFGLGALAANRELMVMRSAGMSVYRVALAAGQGGVVLMVLCLLLGDLAIPPAEETARDLRAAARSGGQVTTRVHGRLWLRDGPDYVNVERLPARDHAQGVRIYRFDGQTLVSTMHARSAHYDDGGWQLYQAAETRLGADGTEVREYRRVHWQTSLSPALIGLFVVTPESLTMRGLHDYVGYLRANDLDSTDYEVALWRKIVTPVSSLLMVFLAVPFVLGPLRSAGAGQRIVAGVLVGMTWYMANTLLVGSGQVWGMHPGLAAGIPAALLALVAWVGMRRVA